MTTNFRTAVRAATIELLEDYKDAVNVLRAAAMEPPFVLQIYPGRPRSVNPPTAFVDRISEDMTYTGPTLLQRQPRVELVVLFGVFDSKEAVDQADAFHDGFLAYVTQLPHAAGDNTTFAIVESSDEPTFVNDWVQPSEQRIWFGTRYILEGYAEN
jgi:hypothetical protein